MLLNTKALDQSHAKYFGQCKNDYFKTIILPILSGHSILCIGKNIYARNTFSNTINKIPYVGKSE